MKPDGFMSKSTSPTCVIHPLSLGLRSLMCKTGVEGFPSFCRDLRLEPGQDKNLHQPKSPSRRLHVGRPALSAVWFGDMYGDMSPPVKQPPWELTAVRGPGSKPPRAETAEVQAPEIHESGDGYERGCDLMQTILPASLASSAPAPSQPAGQAGCKHLSCLWTQPATAQGPALS